MVPFIIKSNGVSLFPADAAPIVIDSSHMNFNAVVDALRNGDTDEAVRLASVKSFLNTISQGKVTVDENGVYFNGTPITGYLTERMRDMLDEGLPLEHYCRFMENLQANPSRTSREELYMFLEAADLPITEDGCFLAYKAVRHDFKDKHSGTFDNSPGNTLTMPRREVDDNRNVTCSYGFHAAAYEYAWGFLGGSGDKMVVVKINPADVVSIPSDYNNQKLRCCQYTVLWEVPGAFDVLKDRNFLDTTSVSGRTFGYDPADEGEEGEWFRD